MAWLQLDPASIAARARSLPGGAGVPGLGGSLLRGVIGFMLTSVLGFVPWAVFGHLLHPAIGEAGMYAVCAVVFMVLSGLFLHGLIIGPGSLRRFYVLFTPAFALYAVIWTVCWMEMRGSQGGALGLLGGAMVMAAFFVAAFQCGGRFVAVAAALFLGNATGYFLGGWVEGQLFAHSKLLAMLMWGVCYGVGFGAGLGLAFYLCQAKARSLIVAKE